MTKVLFITTSPIDVSGVTRTSLDLARQFAARGWRVRSVFPPSPRGQALVERARGTGIMTEQHPAVRDIVGPHTLGDMRALRRLATAGRPDVVNIHYGQNYISLKDVIAARLARPPRLVVTVHHPVPWSDMGGRKRAMTRLATLFAHAVTVNSRAMRDILLEAGVSPRKIHILPPGVHVPASLPGRDEARARLGLPVNAFVVGCVARLEPHKGVGDLIEAAARVPDPEGRLRVVVAGDGPERATLENLGAALLGDRALLLGRVSDIGDVYAAADVFALPSHMEGFGLVYIEAAFHGVPSIGTGVGGVPDVVLDSETGLLVPPSNPDALAAAIARLRDDGALRRRLGAAARARAYAEFTEERMADRYASLFGHDGRDIGGLTAKGIVSRGPHV